MEKTDLEPHIAYFLLTEEELEREEEKKNELLDFLSGVEWGEIGYRSNYVVENMDIYRVPDSIYANRDLFNNINWDFKESIKYRMARGYEPAGSNKRFIPIQFVTKLCLPYKIDGTCITIKAGITYMSTYTMLCCISHFYSSNLRKLEDGFLDKCKFDGFDVSLPENTWTLKLKLI